jgi:hypothetical protein
LESFKVLLTKSGGRITAAATTGPAKQPRPASSQPASILSWWKNGKSFAIRTNMAKKL